jgi:hypothetical protein
MEIGGTLLIPDIRANIVDKSLTCVPFDMRGSCRYLSRMPQKRKFTNLKAEAGNAALASSSLFRRR